MAKFHLSIEADSIEELMGLFADRWDGIVPARGEPVVREPIRDEGIAAALAEGEKKPRTRRTKAEMAEAAAEENPAPAATAKEAVGSTAAPSSAPASVEKANGATELTLNDVREAANAALQRAGGKGEAIKAALEETFGTKLFSALTADQYGPAIDMLKSL